MAVLKDLVRKLALQNAVLHEGKAEPKAVLGKVLASDPTQRSRAREVSRIVQGIVQEVNALSPSEQRALLEKEAPELLERRAVGTRRELPDLPGLREQVVMRLAPYPSGPLHIGNARMVILNDEYVRRYGGRLLLVHDDTIGSEEKLPLREAYEWVEEGLQWLGVEYHEVLYKSDRLLLFYEWGRRLLETGDAYVCLCPAEQLRRNRGEGRACVHRSASVEEGLDGWDRMLAGGYGPGEAVVRLKTDMEHPNPAFRDRVLFRISDREHPRVGDRYHVWPLLEFSWAVDDHLLGVTHVLRGKELMMEDEMERAVWTILGVEEPEFVHYGRMRLEGAELSKSAQRRMIEAGELADIYDPRTWTLQSLERRGIHPQAIRSFILGFGLSLTDVEVPVETLYTENRRIIDPQANRYFFVPDPVLVPLKGLPELRDAKIPLHPDFPDRGFRTLPAAEEVYLPRADLDALGGNEIRLKDLCNVRLNGEARFSSWKVRDIPKVQWLPKGLPTRVLLPDGKWVEGLAEESLSLLSAGALVQFERFGFVRLGDLTPSVTARFAHR